MEKFKLWLKTNYNFDCNKNDFYPFVLQITFNRLEATFIEDIPFFDYHSKNLFYNILGEYLNDLRFLLKKIPPLPEAPIVAVNSVALNQFSAQKEYLLYELSQLKSQFEG